MIMIIIIIIIIILLLLLTSKSLKEPFNRTSYVFPYF